MPKANQNFTKQGKKISQRQHERNLPKDKQNKDKLKHNHFPQGKTGYNPAIARLN